MIVLPEPRKRNIKAMQFNRVGNAKRNIIYGVIYRAAALLMPFATRTVMQRVIGIEYLGLNSLFLSVLRVMSLAELGFSNAVVYSMYKPVAENDESALSALLNYFRKVYRYVGLTILLIGLSVTPFLPKLVHNSCPNDVNLYYLYFIYLADTVISYLMYGYLSALPAAYQRVDITSRISLGITVAMNLAQIATLILLRNYYAYAILLPVFTVLNNFCIAIAVRKMFPNISCTGTVPKEVRRDIIQKVKGLMVYKLCITSRNAFDSIVISTFIGLSATAVYNNYYYIIAGATSLMTIITTSITPSIGNSIVIDSKEKNFKDFCRFNFLFMWVSSWCTVCLVCLAQPFMKIWMGESLTFPMLMVILFCLYFYILRMGDIRATYVQATGLWWEHRYQAIIEAVSNLVLNIVLCRFFGIYGVIIVSASRSENAVFTGHLARNVV